MDNKIYHAINAKLAEALDILTDEIPTVPPDMPVTEWNATPIGRACSRIQDAINLLDDVEVEGLE